MSRILNVIQCANLGGMEKVNLLRLVALKKRGHIVKMISINPIGELRSLLEEARIDHEGLAYKGPAGFLGIGDIRKKMREFSPDAIIQTGHNMAATAAMSGICVGRRLLCLQYHHSESLRLKWKLIYWQALKTFNRITYCADFIRNEAIGIVPEMRARSEVLYDPCEMPLMISLSEKQKARRKLKLKPTEWVIGNGGWLIKRKRFDVFINVLARLNSIHPTRGLIAGDGPERAALKNFAKQKGIGGRILWLGWIKDIRNFYAALDVLEFNSDFDALCRTPIEASTLGIPSVCSLKDGGLNEIFGKIKGLEALNEHDESKLTNRCVQFLKNKKLGRSSSERLRIKLKAIGDPEDHARRVEALLGIK